MTCATMCPDSQRNAELGWQCELCRGCLTTKNHTATLFWWAAVLCSKLFKVCRQCSGAVGSLSCKGNLHALGYPMPIGKWGLECGLHPAYAQSIHASRKSAETTAIFQFCDEFLMFPSCCSCSCLTYISVPLGFVIVFICPFCLNHSR